jgi:hypothetical protein
MKARVVGNALSIAGQAVGTAIKALRVVRIAHENAGPGDEVPVAHPWVHLELP